MIRCLLVDDHPVVRTGYGRLLEMSGMKVVGEAVSVDQGYALYRTCCPDVTVTDLSLPGASGIELIRRIVACDGGAVLAFSMLDPHVAVPRVIEAGGRGFIGKDSPPEMLVDAVRAIHQRGRWFPPALDEADRAWQEGVLRDLSIREVEVLRLLAQGCSTSDCASVLHISPKTVANYQSRLREKLGVDNAAAMVHVALRHGVLGVASGVADLAVL